MKGEGEINDVHSNEALALISIGCEHEAVGPPKH